MDPNAATALVATAACVSMAYRALRASDAARAYGQLADAQPWTPSSLRDAVATSIQRASSAASTATAAAAAAPMSEGAVTTAAERTAATSAAAGASAMVAGSSGLAGPGSEAAAVAADATRRALRGQLVALQGIARELPGGGATPERSLAGHDAVVVRTLRQRIFRTALAPRAMLHRTVLDLSWNIVPWGVADAPPPPPPAAAVATATTTGAIAERAAASVGQATTAWTVADAVAASQVASQAAAGAGAVSGGGDAAATTTAAAVAPVVQVLGAHGADSSFPFLEDGGAHTYRFGGSPISRAWRAFTSFGRVDEGIHVAQTVLAAGTPVTVIGALDVDAGGAVRVTPHKHLGLVILSAVTASGARVADVAARYRRLGLYRVLLSVVLGSIAAVCIWRVLGRRWLNLARRIWSRMRSVFTLADNTPIAAGGDVAAKPGQECVICYDRKRCIVFLDCGHVACCITCTNELMRQRRHGRRTAAARKCPVCRAPISRAVRVYGVPGLG